MAQVIVWNRGKYYNRVDSLNEDGFYRSCRDCVARDSLKLCLELSGSNGPESHLFCGAVGADAEQHRDPLFAYRFEEME